MLEASADLKQNSKNRGEVVVTVGGAMNFGH